MRGACKIIVWVQWVLAQDLYVKPTVTECQVLEMDESFHSMAVQSLKQWSSTPNVYLACFRDTCTNGRQYSWCQFSQDQIILEGEELTSVTDISVEGVGNCAYVVMDGKGSTISQIKAFCGE